MTVGEGMTVCPICRARPELVDECICEDGLIEEELIQNVIPGWRDNTWVTTVALVGVAIWGTAIWRVLF